MIPFAKTPFRWFTAILAVAGLVLGLETGSAIAQAPGIAPEHSAWGKFRRGAWRKVRIVTETFDETGKVSSTSVTTTTSTLRRANRITVVLVEDSVVVLAGRTVTAAERDVEEDLFGRFATAAANISESGKAMVVVDGKAIECRVLTYSTSDRITQRKDQVYYAPEASPFVLMRVSQLIDSLTNKPISETKQTVTEMNRQERVIGMLVNLSEHETITKDSKGRTETNALHSLDVPGSVVWEETKEYSSADRLIRKTTVELVATGEGRARLFGR